MARKIEGKNAVHEFLQTEKMVYEIYVAIGVKRDSIKEILQIANGRSIKISFIDKEGVDNIATVDNHQGVIALVEDYQYATFEKTIDAIEGNGFVLILDNLKDPHNLGAILRTADATGVDAVIIPKDRSVEVTPTVTKVSVGATEHIPVIKVTNIARTIDKLKEKKYWITAADMDGEKAFFESDLKGNVGIVIGSEGEGIRRLVREKCDFIVNIPMKGRIQSLNASVAASILMYEVVRQNHGKN
ncbi:MAG TPA: 23S rRNA (guanosine(2251)-2'-O)-methyltransferase RlmB [Clostridia bacterium]|nr:23S rRNA (guanosine(2251)-2'-O)-methyltransferase RlmB [Clostridia bacterium]